MYIKWLLGETKNQINSNHEILLFGERENQSTRGKTSQSRVENKQTQPTYGIEVRVEPWGHIGGR